MGGSLLAKASTFEVTINTSSLAGQSGGIYFQFAPGLNADPASVSFADFTPGPGGKLDAGSALNFTDGGVSGSLDAGDLVINNNFALNDYGEALTFGKEILFDVTLNLPAVLHGDSGSELAIQVTGSDLLTPLLTSDPSGNIAEISYDQNGSLNVLSTSSAASVTEVANVPEPGAFGLALYASCMLLLGCLKRGYYRR